MAATVGVGLLGLGTVGSAVATRLISHWELLGRRGGVMPVLRRVAVRDLQRRREVDLRSAQLGDDPAAVVDDPAVRVVVEVMGGVQPATQLIQRALRQGKSVVTANKAVIASSGPQLSRLAAQQGCSLRFEAAVGAGLPIVALLQHSLRADRVSSIDAVINGTTNVILTRMRAHGVSFATALREAQQRGFAEADPSSDVEGWDAAFKLVIMAWLAFGVHVVPEEVDRHGIGDISLADLAYTGQLGYTVKLLAHAEQEPVSERLHLRVHPTLIPAGHLLFAVDDSDNSVIISSDMAQHVVLSGLGAGGASTASAVVSDIVETVRDGGTVVGMQDALTPPTLTPEDVETAGYLRLVVQDTTDARGLVVQALEDRGVPVVECVEKPPLDGELPQLLVLTGAAPLAVHGRALETIDSVSVVREVACALDRIEPA